MKAGDTVWVYPHGSPDKRTQAKVVLLSSNGLAIALAFGDPPGFRTSGEGVAIHPEHGVMMLAHRVELNGAPWGPWVELFRGGHFEVEELDDGA